MACGNPNAPKRAHDDAALDQFSGQPLRRGGIRQRDHHEIGVRGNHFKSHFAETGGEQFQSARVQCKRPFDELGIVQRGDGAHLRGHARLERAVSL